MTNQFILINDDFVLEHDANISVKERGFRFGDGMFETIYVHNAICYNLQFHMKRLFAGLSAVKIKYDQGALECKIQQIIEKNSLLNGFVRLSISRGIGSRGYRPNQQLLNGKNKPLLVIETMIPTYEIDYSAKSLHVSSYQKISNKSLPVEYKTMQGMSSTLAILEAQEAGAYDAILLNERGLVCETTAANIFWYKNNQLFTPHLDCGLLMGSIRYKLLKLSPYKVTEGHFTIDHLKEADSVFITNSAYKIMPVNRILCNNVYEYDSKVFADGLRKLIFEDIYASCKK